MRCQHLAHSRSVAGRLNHNVIIVRQRCALAWSSGRCSPLALAISFCLLDRLVHIFKEVCAVGESRIAIARWASSLISHRLPSGSFAPGGAISSHSSISCLTFFNLRCGGRCVSTIYLPISPSVLGLRVVRQIRPVVYQLLRQTVEARITAKSVEIFHRGKLVATHRPTASGDRRVPPMLLSDCMRSSSAASRRRVDGWQTLAEVPTLQCIDLAA